MRPFAAVLLALGAVGCAAQPEASSTRTYSEDSERAGHRQIAEFQGEYRFLSNFWPAQIEYQGIRYPSVEHAYQAAKTFSAEERRRIAAIPDPAEAKRAGRALALRSDWETAKFEVMEDCVRAKFMEHPDLRAKLVATGNAELIEGNTWGDRVWGVYQGEGENRLGKILMKVREECRRTSVGS